MGPRSSISGELPIDTYFNPAGAVRRKENGSMKRRAGADADDANQTRTKKQRIKQPSKGANLEAQEKSRSGSADARPKAVTGLFATTSIPTPISLPKLPRSASPQVHTDMEVITITSSSPPREIVLGPGDALRSARNAASGSSLPTPQTVSHEAKRNRTAAVGTQPVPTASRSAWNSGPAIPSFHQRPPLTPSRPRNKPDHIPLVHRTTPHSQRIVPSSQWSDDEQSNSASTLEANKDLFLLRRTEESDSCPDDMTLPPPSDVPSSPYSSTSSLTPAKSGISGYPTFTGLVSGQRRSLENKIDNGNSGNTKTHPISLSGSSRSVLLLSSGFGRSQSSQIEPTSQIDEIELKFSSQRLFDPPILSPQTNKCDLVPSIERSQTGGPLRTSHSEVIVEQESSSTNHCCEPSPPPSPLTPLSSTSSLLSDAMHSEMDTMGVNRSPSQHASRETLDSPAPCSSPQFMVDLEMRGTAQHLPEMEILTEGPASREDGNSSVHRSPDRRPPPPANVQNMISLTGDCPSPGAHSHPRISHAKLRSLPDPAIELDSEGEEMSPTSSFSIPATSQEMTTSYSASSCLDLVGTLPSEVGDFLDMVDAYAFSQP